MFKIQRIQMLRLQHVGSLKDKQYKCCEENMLR